MAVITIEKTTPALDLQEYTKALNDTCKNLQGSEKEFVPDEKAYEAYCVVKNMHISDAGDVLLFCASMNLLNTYVKQKNSKISYKFKKDIHYMTNVLLNLNISDVFIDYQENEALLVVQIFEIQFSFHFVRKKKEIIQLCKSHHYKELLWDGIRKQKCALSLFESVRKNQIRTCGVTFRGKPLDAKINKMLAIYLDGKSSFEELI